MSYVLGSHLMNGAELSHRDRRALVGVTVQFFANGAMTASFIARAPQIRDQIGVDVGRFGLLLTVAATIGILGSLFAGRIIHAMGTRRVLQLGAVAMIASLPLIGAARTPFLWLVGMFVYGLFDTLVDISMNLQGAWISARRHAPIMNRLHGLWSVGAFIGGLGAVSANSWGLSPLTHLSLVAALMTCVLALVMRHLLPYDAEGQEDEAAQVSPHPRSSRAARLPLILLVLAGMFAVMMEVTASDWSTFRLADDFDAPGASSSAAFVAFTAGMTLMRFGGDLLEVRLGKTGLFRFSITLAVGGLVAASLVPVAFVAVGGFLLTGLGVATMMPKLYDDAARVPGRRGAGLGAMTAGMRVAYLFTPLAIGGLANTSLSVGAAIAIYSLPAAMGLVMVSERASRSTRS